MPLLDLITVTIQRNCKKEKTVCLPRNYKNRKNKIGKIRKKLCWVKNCNKNKSKKRVKKRKVFLKAYVAFFCYVRIDVANKI